MQLIIDHWKHSYSILLHLPARPNRHVLGYEKKIPWGWLLKADIHRKIEVLHDFLITRGVETFLIVSLMSFKMILKGMRLSGVKVTKATLPETNVVPDNRPPQ